MTAPIRPGMTSLVPTAAPQRSAAALAAQRAFFQQALVQAGQAAPVVTTPVAAARPSVQPSQAQASPGPAPDAAPRPGRYLDIRV